MNYECCYNAEQDLWAPCLVVDDTTSPTHKFVRLELESEAVHVWMLNERIRSSDSRYSPT